MSASVILEFISLLPSFWRQYLKWQQERDEESYQEYVTRRETVIAMLKDVNGDPKKAFEAAVSAQRLLRSGK